MLNVLNYIKPLHELCIINVREHGSSNYIFFIINFHNSFYGNIVFSDIEPNKHRTNR